MTPGLERECRTRQPAPLGPGSHTARRGLGHEGTTSDAAHGTPVPAPAEGLSPARGVCHRLSEDTVPRLLSVSLLALTTRGPQGRGRDEEKRAATRATTTALQRQRGWAFTRDWVALGLVAVRGGRSIRASNTDSAGPGLSPGAGPGPPHGGAGAARGWRVGRGWPTKAGVTRTGPEGLRRRGGASLGLHILFR